MITTDTFTTSVARRLDSDYGFAGPVPLTLGLFTTPRNTKDAASARANRAAFEFSSLRRLNSDHPLGECLPYASFQPKPAM